MYSPMSYDIIALPPEKDPHVWVALTNSIKKEDSPPHFLCREQLCMLYVCTMCIGTHSKRAYSLV